MATRKKKEVIEEIKEEKKPVVEQEIKKPARKKIPKVKVDSLKVNVRKTPSLLGEIIGVVSAGDKLELVSDVKEAGFYNVKFEGKSAYIMADFVRVE